MEIVRSNFKESLNTVSEAIDSASLLAIDAEFSGLNVKWGAENCFDTPQERYSKLKEGCRDFICLLYTSPSPRDLSTSRMPSSA